MLHAAVGLLAIWNAVAVPRADVAPARQLEACAHAAQQARRYLDAEKCARQLEARAHAAQQAGHYLDAEKPLLAAIAIWKRYPGPGDIEVLNDRMNLAVAYRRAGEARRAIPMLEAVASGFAASHDPDARALHQQALNNLGTAYWDAGRHDEAQHTFQACLASLDAAAPSEQRARVLDNLASVLLAKSAAPAAEGFARRALAEWRQLRGEDDVDYAISLSALGTALMRQEKLDAARPMLERSLHTQEKLLGPNHVQLAGVLDLLGELESKSGQCPKARTDYQRASEICAANRADQTTSCSDAQAGLRATEPCKQAH